MRRFSPGCWSLAVAGPALLLGGSTASAGMRARGGLPVANVEQGSAAVGSSYYLDATTPPERYTYTLGDRVYASDFDTSSFMSHRYMPAAINPSASANYSNTQTRGCQGASGDEAFGLNPESQIAQSPTLVRCWNPATAAYAQKGLLSHAYYEHGSILRLIEDQFGVPRLAASDARAKSPRRLCLDFKQSPRKFSLINAWYYTNYFTHHSPALTPRDID